MKVTLTEDERRMLISALQVYLDSPKWDVPFHSTETLPSRESLAEYAAQLGKLGEKLDTEDALDWEGTWLDKA